MNTGDEEGKKWPGVTTFTAWKKGDFLGSMFVRAQSSIIEESSRSHLAVSAFHRYSDPCGHMLCGHSGSFALKGWHSELLHARNLDIH